MTRIRAGVTALSITHPQLKQTMYAIMNSTPQTVSQNQSELELVRGNIEEWFNNAMDRLTGWYKRRCLITTLLVGTILAVIINIDSVNLVSRLWSEPDLRFAILNNIEGMLTQDNTTILNVGPTFRYTTTIFANYPSGWLVWFTGFDGSVTRK